MTEPNPFLAYQQPSGQTTPPPITVSPTQNPATVSPTVADPAAQYAAWQAAQAAQAAAAQVAPAPVAPPVDPAYAAWLATTQQAAPVAAPAAPVDPAYAAFLASQQPAQFVAPTPQPSGAPSGGTDPFDDPAPPRPKGPRLDDMYNRLLIIIPKGMDKGKSTEADGTTSTYDRMSADVVVLDGGPMPYGGKPNGRPPTPHDRTATIPHREVAMYISAKAIISQSRVAWEKRQRGEPGMVLGRLGYGEQPADPKMTAPWLLSDPTDADKAIARAYLATVDPFA